MKRRTAALIAASAAALLVAGAATVTAHAVDGDKQPTPPAVRKTITGWIIR